MHGSPTRLLCTTEAARMVGVGPSTLKRWADAGSLACTRTPGGHRRFALSDLESFLRLKNEDVSGLNPSSDWLKLLLSGYPHEIESTLIEDRARLGSWAHVADSLTPVLAELGKRWVCGEISIADEHLASAKLLRALRRVADALPSTLQSPRCVLACLQGERHTLGLSLAELCLQEAGWQSIWLGADTPSQEIEGLVLQGQTELVAISVSEHGNDPQRLIQEIRALEMSCSDTQTPLIVGGRGLGAESFSYATRPQRFVEFAQHARRLRTKRP